MVELYADRMNLVKPSSIRELLKFGADPDMISFGGGFPDPELFPVDKLKSVFDHVLTNHGKAAMQYSTSEGLPALREKLVARMGRAGVGCTMDELILIQGGQQGLDLVAKMFLNKGDVVVVERPSFLGALIAFNPYEPAYAPVDMDENGMDMEDLERILKTTPNVKIVYTVPEFQNPTGRTMPAERRKRLVELANQYNVIVLEDSPYREIRYEGEAIVPVKSFDTQGRVIHLGSFSKILCPGMRLGWLVAEKEMTTKLCQLKTAADTQNSTLNMYAADTFLERYDIDEHIGTLRAVYRNKKDLMLATMGKVFPRSVTYTNPEGGLFTWLTLPEGGDAAALMRDKLVPLKVAYVPGGDFYATDVEHNHARVNYSCMSEDNIVLGVERMGKVFAEAFGK